MDAFLSETSSAHTLHVVIDSDPSMGALHQQLRACGFDTLLLPASAGLNGLDALLDHTRPSVRFEAISLYCHGQAASLDLGDQPINRGTVDANAAALQELGAHLAPGGDLLLYGCSLAGSPNGRELVDRIATLAGVDVAASTDPTGVMGDWELEYQRGSIATTPVDALTGLPWSGSLTTISKPVRIPLHWFNVDESASNPQKLGLYVTLGGGTTPQVFEFDTGGDGFYAVYSPTSSDWWGSDWDPTPNSFNQSYDSGLNYQGQAVTTTIRLFADGQSSEPLLTAEDVVVGQTTTMLNTKKDPVETLWPLPKPDSLPPTNGVFYGDFGMALKQGQAGIDSLVSQLSFGTGVMAGFRVHASAKEPWVQFGLRKKDLGSRAKTLRLNPSGNSSETGIPYYENLVVTGSVSIKKPATGDQKKVSFLSPTGMIFDTGASTTLHIGDGVVVPQGLTDGNPPKRIISEASFLATAPRAHHRWGGSPARIMAFKTGDKTNKNKVSIQLDSPSYYLNTGIQPFYKNDFVYRLSEGLLTLVPR